MHARRAVIVSALTASETECFTNCETHLNSGFVLLFRSGNIPSLAIAISSSVVDMLLAPAHGAVSICSLPHSESVHLVHAQVAMPAAGWLLAQVQCTPRRAQE